MGSSSDVFLARAALRQHFSRIQRAIRDAYQGNSPNVMITCDEFAILAAEAVAEAASMNVHALREAAAMLFTKKLDASGSGVVSVRQVNSLLSFGYAEAAGVPKPVGREHFVDAPRRVRDTARLYGNPGLLVSPGRGTLPKSASQPRMKPVALKPLAVTTRAFPSPDSLQDAMLPHQPPVTSEFSHMQPAARPEGASGSRRAGPPSLGMNGLGETTRPARPSPPQQQFHVPNDDFGEIPEEASSSSSDEDYEDDFDDFQPWGEVDAIHHQHQRTVHHQQQQWDHIPPPISHSPAALQPPQPLAAEAQPRGMRASESLPALPMAAAKPRKKRGPSVASIMRHLSARVHKCPRELRELYEGLEKTEDGQVDASALVAALSTLCNSVHSVGLLAFTDRALSRLVNKFDFGSAGKVMIRDFATALVRGKLPNKRHRLPSPTRARSPQLGDTKRAGGKERIASGGAGGDIDADPASSARPGQSDAAEDAHVQEGSARVSSIHRAARVVKIAPSVATKKRAQPSARPQPAGSRAAMADVALHVQGKDARAAALLIASIRQKSEDTDGLVTRRQFNEVLYELGIVHCIDDETNVLFDSLDADGSGTIHIKELEAATSTLVDPESVSHLESLLQDGSTMETSIASMRDKLSSQASRVVDLFKQWDKNGDGMISQSEFMRAMPYLGLQDCLPIEVASLFNAFDPDGSGEISFRELHRMLGRAPSKKRAEPKIKKDATPKMSDLLLDVTTLRRDIKQDVLRMNLQVELQELIIAKRSKEAERKQAGASKPTANLHAMQGWDLDDDGFQYPEGSGIVAGSDRMWKTKK